MDLTGADGYAPNRDGSGPRGLASLSMPAVTQIGPATYNPGQSVDVTCTFAPGGEKLLALGWKPQVPAGWTVESVSGDGTPELVRGEILCTGTLPATPVRLSYTVRAPLTACGTVSFGGAAVAMANGMVNPETYAMDAIAMTALDANGNGMADAWERQYAGAAGSLDPDGDLDNDHLSNYAEYLCGTVPTDAASVLQMVSLNTLPDGTTQITWSSVAGRVYILQRADGSPAAAKFKDIQTGIQADPSGRNVYVDTADRTQSRFYRVLLQVQ